MRHRDDRASGYLARLRDDTGRRLPDCSVLLAAVERDGVVASLDSALIAAAGDLTLD